MANKALPLLLLGGAAVAAFAMSGKKKESKVCPTLIKVSIEDLEKAEKKASKTSTTDIKAYANAFMKALLPKACSKNSKSSKLQIKLEGGETFEFPLPFIYLTTLSNISGGDNGQVTPENQKLIEDETKVYKELMGEDPVKYAPEFFRMVSLMTQYAF